MKIMESPHCGLDYWGKHFSIRKVLQYVQIQTLFENWQEGDIELFNLPSFLGLNISQFVHKYTLRYDTEQNLVAKIWNYN